MILYTYDHQFGSSIQHELIEINKTKKNNKNKWLVQQTSHKNITIQVSHVMESYRNENINMISYDYCHKL